jgi:thiol:disulfide interchange protein DsbD
MRIRAVLAAAILAAGAARAETPLLTASASVDPPAAAAGGAFTVKMRAVLAAGYHANAHVPSEEFLIPTAVELDPAPGVTLGPVRYPSAISKKFAFAEKPLAVYEGSFDMTAQGKVDAAVPSGKIEIRGRVTFQACTDKQCLAPSTAPFSTSLAVSPAAATAGSSAPAAPPGSSDLAAKLSQRGFLGALLLVFVGGLALNLTPCVYPIIPITVGFFGGQASREGRRPVGLAIVYVLGLALMYSTLGVVAALSGKLFGAALQSPWVLGAIILVLIALSLSMFGLYDIQPPRFLMNRAGARTGWGGAFLMGLLVGVVAAPCLGPFVLGLLTLVASRHDPVYGFAMFFVLSIGLGLPYVFLAAFSGNLTRLPRAGEWMVGVKKIFGFVLLAMAAYFLKIVLPEPLHTWLFPGFLALAGFWLALTAVTEKGPGLARAVTAMAAVVFLGAALVLRPAFSAAAAETAGSRSVLPFQPYDGGAIPPGQPVLIDFSADWCIPCHELDDRTFADPAVRTALSGFRLLKADMTRQDSPTAVALAKRYAILGMPTIVFLDAAGKEAPDSRLAGFEPPGAFLERLKRLPR